MSFLQPNHRAASIFEKVQKKELYTSINAYESALFQYWKTNEVLMDVVKDALDVWIDEDSRHVVNALILAKYDDKKIAYGLDMPEEILPPYKHLFFDRSIFKNSIAVLKYVEQLDLADNLKNYYLVATQQGPEFLINRFSVGFKEIDPRFVKRAVLSAQFDRFVIQRGKPLYNEEKKGLDEEVLHAMKFGEKAVQTAVAIIEKGEQGSETAIQQLRIILEGKSEVKPITDVVVNKEDIVG